MAKALNGDREGQKEIYKRGEPKHKSKDDGEVVYLSNEEPKTCLSNKNILSLLDVNSDEIVSILKLAKT